jgi:hypothetical protein
MLLVLAFSSTQVLAQWESVGQFPTSDTFTVAMHGVAVDPDGKVWLTPYFPSEELEVSEDSVVSTRAIYAFNADGTPADFSPIQILMIDGEPDTLLSPSTGLVADADGNIIHVTGDGWLYRIDYQTGEGLDRMEVQEAASQAKPAVDDSGNIFTANVFGDAGPLRIFDSELNFIENAVDTTRGFSRGFEVTADGNTIYWGGFTNEAIWKYTRPDEFSPFNATPDTTELVGMVAESFARHPVTGNIWISAGTGAVSPFVIGTWYEIDPATDEVLDSLVWDRSAGFATEKPRGIAFSPDGMTAYAVMFDATSGAPSVQEFELVSVPPSIEKEPGDLPKSFALEQNYPNPFNPSTEIGFDLNEAGHVSLKVFDVLGREVAVLVDEHLTNGAYRFTFDAANLTSGTYVYVLSANGERQSASMVLAK